MSLKANCFICKDDVSFNPKTIHLITNHVHTCIQQKLDENGIDRFPTQEDLIEKQKIIDDLQNKIKYLEKQLNQINEIEINDDRLKKKKTSTNEFNNSFNLVQSSLINVPQSTTIPQTSIITPQQSAIPPIPSVQQQTSSVPQTTSLFNKPQIYQYSQSMETFIQCFSTNIQNMFRNPNTIPKIQVNEKEGEKCYFCQHRSLLGFTVPKFEEQDFAACSNEEQIIHKLQELSSFLGCNNIGRSSMRFQMTVGNRSLNLPLPSDKINVKCRACKNMCNDTIKIKGENAMELESSDTLFCSISCCYRFISNSKSNDWQAVMEIGTIKKENKSKKNKSNENDEQDEDNQVDEDEKSEEEQGKLPKIKVGTPKKSKKQNIEKVMGDELNFKSMIGLSYTQFLDLVNDLEENYKNKKTFKKRGRIKSFNFEQRVFISLSFLRHYSRPIIYKMIYDIDEKTLDKYFNEFLELIEPLAILNFEKVFQERTDEKKCMDYYVGETHYLTTLVVDGSEQQITIPLNIDVRNMLFSGKKGKSTLTLLVYCCPKTGKITHIGFPCGGCKNDINLFDRDQDKFISKLDSKLETILADKGFRGLDRVYKNIQTIPRGKRSDYQKTIDNKQKSIRIIIENVFARIKQFYMASMSLRYKFKKDSIDIDKVLRRHHLAWCSIGYLVNKYKQIRKETYYDDVELTDSELI
ncbi:hypothetical protein ACTFIY_000809 [Dictyostelium cf. discoideum]